MSLTRYLCRGKSSDARLVGLGELFDLRYPKNCTHTLNDSVIQNSLHEMTDFSFRFVFIRSELTASSLHRGGKVGIIDYYNIVDFSSKDGPNKVYEEVLKTFDSTLSIVSEMYERSTLNHRTKLAVQLSNKKGTACEWDKE